MEPNFKTLFPYSHDTVRAVGLVWYRREDYAKVRKIFADGHKLPATFDQWLKRAKRKMEKIQREGHVVVKVYIDPDTFPDWCREQGIRVDANARTIFAGIAAKAKHGQTH